MNFFFENHLLSRKWMKVMKLIEFERNFTWEIKLIWINRRIWAIYWYIDMSMRFKLNCRGPIKFYQQVRLSKTLCEREVFNKVDTPSYIAFILCLLTYYSIDLSHQRGEKLLRKKRSSHSFFYVQINNFFPFYKTPRDVNLKQAKKKYNLIYILFSSLARRNSNWFGVFYPQTTINSLNLFIGVFIMI